MSNIQAVGRVSEVTISNQFNFYIHFEVSATDGVTTVTPDMTGDPVSITPTVHANEADDLIRRAMVAAILASNPAFVIDPNDIYIPFGLR